MSETPITAARGEFEIELGGESYGLRPSNEAVDAIEAQTGKALLQLYYAALAEGLKKREIGIIVGECVRAWGRAKSLAEVAAFKNERLSDLVMEAPGGFMSVQARLAVILFKAATGGVTHSGEAKAKTA